MRVEAVLVLALAIATLLPCQVFAECEEVYTVPSGETLELISSDCYGDRYYGFIIEMVNDLQDADRIRAGQVLRLPSLREFLTEEGAAEMAPAEVDLLLAAHSGYRAIERQLWSRLQSAPRPASDEDRHLDLSKQTCTALLKVAADLNRCADLLVARSQDDARALRRAVRQLRSAAQLAQKLAGGSSDGNGYDIAMVHQHMALAIRALVDWTSGGEG